MGDVSGRYFNGLGLAITLLWQILLVFILDSLPPPFMTICISKPRILISLLVIPFIKSVVRRLNLSLVRGLFQNDWLKSLKFHHFLSFRVVFYYFTEHFTTVTYFLGDHIVDVRMRELLSWRFIFCRFFFHDFFGVEIFDSLISAPCFINILCKLIVDRLFDSLHHKMIA